MGSLEQGADAIHNRWLTIPRTLSFVLCDGDILLIRRAPHRRIFPNRYNGVGGHIERDEDPYSSAIREIKEETGLHVRDVALKAVYNIDAGAATGIMLFVFTAHADTRQLPLDRLDTSEGTLHWIARSDLEKLDLVEDLPVLLPRILDRPGSLPPFFVHVSYDERDQILMRFADLI